MIGPVLFIIYMNDLSEIVQNEVYLFADGTKIYSEIGNMDDSKSHKEDLNNLKIWADIGLLAFHPHKCKVLSLGNRIDDVYDYRLDQTLLEHTDYEKDLVWY